MLKAIGHQGIRCADIEKSIRFYQDVLGMKPAFRKLNDDGSIRLVYMMATEDGGMLELFPGGEGEKQRENKNARGHLHICYVVTEIETWFARMFALGLVAGEVRQGSIGSKLFFIADPDGNRIELTEIPDESDIPRSVREIRAGKN